MNLDKKSRTNLLVGSTLTTLVTLPTLTIVFGDVKQPSFLPNNAWLWLALWMLLLGGLFVSLIGLLRKIHWGYFLWSQTMLSFWVLIIYIGQYRADKDYVKFGPDPDAIYQGPPETSWLRLLFLILIWLVIGFLPLTIRSLWRGYKRRKSRTRENGASPD